MKKLISSIASLFLLCSAAAAQELPNADLLNQPPRPATTADCPKVDEWSTPSEKSCYRTTPRYDQTMAYVRRLAAAAPKQTKLEIFGKTPQGRDLVAVVVSNDGNFDPVSIHAANRPVVYIQNAIHAGEMDGKDASLALLRDILITKKQSALIDRAVLVITLIYNADGHERFGPYNRINQNGPEQMGWRTTARLLNLNRDYMKADAPETRAFLKLWNRWLPDFFIDDHVTDGADYQYDVTYFFDVDASSYQPLAQWIHSTAEPELVRRINASGHLAERYMDFVGPAPDSGVTIGQSTPRFATSYVNLQNRPSLLIEMHMLKDYRTRVLGNEQALRAALEIVNRDAATIIRLNREADQATIAAAASNVSFPLVMAPGKATEPLRFKGYKWTTEKSDLTGGTWVRYTNEPIEITIPRVAGLNVVRSTTVPAAYIVPAEWIEIIEVLSAHGLQLRRTSQPWSGNVEVYRCSTPVWQQQSFEGRHLASWPKESRDKDGSACHLSREKMTFAAGSVVVPTSQRGAKLAVHFLEPEAPDSAVAWGFLDSIFEQKEYGESYVLEKLAREMIARDPKLKAEYEQKLASDPAFTNPYQRLNWFYRRSPWWDDRIGLIPIVRLQSLENIPLAN